MKRKNAMTTRALLALREQVALVNWWEGDHGERFGALFMGQKRRTGTNTHDLNLAEMENAKLDRARTYWVTSDMQTLIRHAAESMPAQPLELGDLPSPCGFLWFEDVMEMTDARGQPISWRAVAWMPARSRGEGAVHLSFYTDLLDHAPEEFKPRTMSTGYHLGEIDRMGWLAEGGPRLLLLHECGWAFGRDYEGLHASVDASLDEETQERIVDEWEFWTRRFVAATWTLVQQKVAARTPEHIPKTELRPAIQALSVPPEIIFVDLRRVVRPKRAHDPDAPPSDVEWNHRWIVDGHWRNQYLPGTGTHRLQWINAFVKGPEDRPLVEKDRVHRVRR